MICPLCHKDEAELFTTDRIRTFFRCPYCTIIFVPRNQILSKGDEKKRYDSHNNDESDPHYRDYFLKTVEPVIRELTPNLKGLDFGCGRTRFMETLFRERGLEMDSYDPFYVPDESIWEKDYDFIVMNEVIEHLADPVATLTKLKSICPGPLFVRTQLYPETDFGNWFYMRDPTHIQFFSMDSLSKIGSVKVLGEDLYKIEWK